jgi:hypothetical protein
MIDGRDRAQRDARLERVPAGRQRELVSRLAPRPARAARPQRELDERPFVAMLRPALSPSRKRPKSSAPPVLTNTRLRPTGPRSDAKFVIASVPAPAGRRKPQLSRRYQTALVALWSLSPTAS